MSGQTEPEIVNYKHIAYRTIFLEFPDIEPTLKGL